MRRMKSKGNPGFTAIEETAVIGGAVFDGFFDGGRGNLVIPYPRLLGKKWRWQSHKSSERRPRCSDGKVR